MRLACVAERQHPIDDSANLSLFDKLHRLQQITLRSHEGSEQREVSIEDLPQIGACGVAAGCAARNESPVVLETADRSGPRRGAGVLNHDVDTFTISYSPDF